MLGMRLQLVIIVVIIIYYNFHLRTVIPAREQGCIVLFTGFGAHGGIGFCFFVSGFLVSLVPSLNCFQVLPSPIPRISIQRSGNGTRHYLDMAT